MYQTSILGLFTKKLYSITLKAFSGLESLIFAAVLGGFVNRIKRWASMNLSN